MKMVRIYRIPRLTEATRNRIREGQLEAARAWNLCRDLHLQARKEHTRWPNRDVLQKAVKGQFELHSQSAQMVAHAFLAAVDATRENRKLRYPYKDKRFYPLLYPAQAISVGDTRIVLPMGRGRKSIVLPRPEGFPDSGVGCKLVYDGAGDYELHATMDAPAVEEKPGVNRATVDLGQIHQAAVTTDSAMGEALIVSGRGIRSEKRNLQRIHGKLRRKLSRCKRSSRRHRKLRRTMNKHSARSKRRVRDLRHKGTRAVVDFCIEQEVGTVYIGNPHGVRRDRSGRKHNQRISGWEYGRDIKYLKEKCERAAIECFTGTERGTSSRCPDCGNQQRPSGRNWKCRNEACRFAGHRDLVGSANMHALAFDSRIEFPTVAKTTYLRPGTVGYADVRVAAAEYPAAGSSSGSDASLDQYSVGHVAEEGIESESTRQAVVAATPNGVPYGTGAVSPATVSETHAL